MEAIQRSDVNACCLPGGIVFVHSGLIRAVEGRQDSLAFVLGHEVRRMLLQEDRGAEVGERVALSHA